MGKGISKSKLKSDLERFVRNEYKHLFSEENIRAIGEFTLEKETGNVQKVQELLSKNYKIICDYYFVRSVNSLCANLVDEAEKNFASYLALLSEFEKNKHKKNTDVINKFCAYWHFSDKIGRKGEMYKYINGPLGTAYTDLNYCVDMSEIVKYFWSKRPDLLH